MVVISGMPDLSQMSNLSLSNGNYTSQAPLRQHQKHQKISEVSQALPGRMVKGASMPSRIGHLRCPGESGEGGSETRDNPKSPG